MVFLEPGEDLLVELTGEVAEFFGFGSADGACGVVFGGVAFGSAGVEIIGFISEIVTHDEREGLQGPVVGEVFLGSVTGGVKDDGAQFQRGVVGDAELPVDGDVAFGVFEVALDDGKQVDDLLGGGFVGTKPAVFSPVLQAHAEFLSAKVWVH